VDHAEVDAEVDTPADAGRWSARRWWLLGAIAVPLAAGLGVGLAVGLSNGDGHSNPPLASAQGLFPQRLFSSNAFGGAKNQNRIHLVAAAAQVPGRQSFSWTLPGLRSGTEWLYVDCTGGRVSVEIGAGATSAPCRGVGGVTGWAVAVAPGPTVSLRVGARQSHRWGVAVYQGQGGF
jgi:hypothetical protein